MKQLLVSTSFFSFQEAIAEEAARSGQSVDEVRAEAVAILKMMAHNWGLNSTRAFGYAVTKVLEKIFDAIYVNAEQIKRIREICKTESVVFMPSHRTYLDFLLLSLFCFQYEVPLPAIAAGMDFTNSWFMSEVLRRSGAFYIRRSIGQDHLYWAILSEYVQTHIVHSDRPVEFFVEGTRSRVGKSLPPKYGLLQMVLEPYLRGKVYDIVVVPVTTNYDKLLEEMLYSYELLGFPKPKETTSGLLKARDFINKRFGRCFMTFGEPISIRNYFGMSLHRSQFVCQPDSQFVLSEVQRKQIKKFAHVVVETLDRNAVITIWSLACATMSQRITGNTSEVLQFKETLLDVQNLLRSLETLGVTIHVAESIETDLRYYVNLHSEMFHPVDKTLPDFQLKLVRFPVLQEGNVEAKIMERSISRLLLATYSNTMMHSIYDVGYVAAIVIGMNVFDVSELELYYRKLQALMGREFIYVPGEESNSFHRALTRLRIAKIIQVSDGAVEVVKREEFQMYRSLILPFISNFQLVLEALLNADRSFFSNKEIVSISQVFIAKLYEASRSTENSVRLSFLSTEPIKNSAVTLISQGVLVPVRNSGNCTLDRSSASALLRDLVAITGYNFHSNSRI
ncbi:unnamed protein product [Heligmosomoides polygyrus]|uniref:PlsC domain-containing protein n=1 Tax=Heligmosomoides polygyrus TaxID=6339 RepID=A0A3P8BZ65_HELPZ|nr:unnamed protein product [Heligmosomoides polygyrus]